MAYDSGTTNPGSGGLVLAVNTFTDTDSVDRTAPFSQLNYGAINSIPTVVTAAVGLPIKLATDQASIPVTGTGTFAVQVSSALPAGTNVIGHIIVDSGTVAATQSGTWNITNVSGVISLPTGASTSAKQDTGNTSLASIDGKLPALGQALAAASVPVVLTASQLATLTPLSTVAVTGVSTASKQDAIISSLSSIDGHVDGVEGSLTSIDAKITACNTGAVVVSSSALPTGAATAARQDTGNSSLSSIDSKTPALGQALAAASSPVVLTADQISTLTPLSTVASTQSGTWTVQPGNTANTTAWLVTGTGGTFPVTGTFWQATQPVSLASVPTHDIGTVTAVTTVSTVTTCSTVTTLTGSSVAHDAADSGNPHKIGAKATTALSAITLVSDADRTNLFAGVDGVQIVRNHCNLEDIVSGVVAITDGSSTTVIAAQSAGVKTYITSVTIANTSATAVTVDLRDGAAGTVKWTFPVPANTSGVVFNFSVPLPFSAATAVCADPSAAASTITVSLLGFKSKV